MKAEKKKISIKWQIFFSFIIFAAISLSLIWVLETVFLNKFYEATKTASMKKAAVNIEENLGNEKLNELAGKLSRDGDMCILVFSQNGNMLCNQDAFPGCILHHISTRDIIALRDKALENNGLYIGRARLEKKTDMYDDSIFHGNVPKSDLLNEEGILYIKIAEHDSKNYVIMLNAAITPLTDTRSTVNIILIIVTVLLVFLSLILALILSRIISKPISKLNKSVKLLATGNYDTVFDADGYREISELSANMQLASNELEKVDDYRRTLLANVSHDLRTPLTLITAYAEMMQDMPNEATAENLQIIVDESKHLNDLVNDVLDISKYNSGEISLNKEVFDLGGLISETMERYNKLKEKDELNIIFEGREKALVNADKMKISQVLYNLINNAINYTGENKNIRVIMRKSDSAVRIDVVDNGKGIPEDKLPLIWNRYYKIDNDHKRTRIGTGLGLSIVKAILERHCALYGANSIPNVGTDIWFELPLEITNNTKQS